MSNNPRAIDVKSLDNGNCLVYWEDNTTTKIAITAPLAPPENIKLIWEILSEYDEKHRAVYEEKCKLGAE